MKAPNNNSNKNGDDALPIIPDEIDWEAVMRDMTPPEWDLLLSAAAKNDLERIQDLIENEDVPVGHSNGVGQTALHVAILWGHINCARYLIQRGAPVNVQNVIAGATPLHLALCSHKISPEQQAAAARLLIEQGNADPLVEDKFGKTPLEYISEEEKKTHPLFQQAHYSTTILPKMKPAPPSVDRLRAGLMQQVVLGMPTCAPIPPKKRSAKKA